MNFIEKAKAVHGDKYDYSKVEYINNKTKVVIVCPEHGEFSQKPSHHLSGHGCRECARLRSSSKQSMLNGGFIEKAKAVHGDKYDYSKVEYINNKTKVVIVCPEHGEFVQSPVVHLRGGNCPKCAREKTVESHFDTKESFIEKAKAVHGDKYDYSKVEYFGGRKEVSIVCPEHGEFCQKPFNHLRGNGCRKCSDISWDLQIFIEKARAVHGDRYDYSKAEYINANVKVEIICKKHGSFFQTPYNHVSGCGCYKCGLSTAQNQLYDYVSGLYDGNIVLNDRKLIGPHEIDILISERNFGIEFNGNYWHSYDCKESPEQKRKHQEKSIKCLKIGLNLFNVWEHQWVNNVEIIKSMISGKLGKNDRIYARKCLVVGISTGEYKEFMNQNHLQGYVSSSIKIGLIYNNEIVAAVGINRHKTYEWEISRFASKVFINVIGGFSRLLSCFIKQCGPKSIMSYANFDHSVGNLYRKNGFEFVGMTKPGYCYLKNKKVYSRQQFQKHKLCRKLRTFNKNISEAENMFNNGYRRMWDCGNLKFIRIFN